MKESSKKKLNTLFDRYLELEKLLISINPMKDKKKYVDISKEYHEIQPIIIEYNKYKDYKKYLKINQDLLMDKDQDIIQLAQEEIQKTKKNISFVENEIKKLLSPVDKNDNKNIFLEIRAGTGGNEATLFAGDLFRMYARFAEKNKWSIEILSSHISDNKGYKEIISKISGKNVYSKLKFESGVHRVQRVPSKFLLELMMILMFLTGAGVLDDVMDGLHMP